MPDMRDESRGTAADLLRGSILRTLELLVMLGATYALTPLLVRALGDRVYAFWTLAGVFVGYYALLDFGLVSAAARYLSQALGREDDGRLERAAGTAFALFCGIACLLGAATLALAAACPRFVSDPAEAALFRKLVLLLGGANALAFPLKIHLALLSAHVRHDVAAAISIARTALFGAALFACLSAGAGVLTAAALSAAASLLQAAAVWAAARARFPGTRVSLALADAALAREMLGYGGKTFLCQLGDILRFRMDAIVIAATLSATLVTRYAIGARLAEGFCQLVLSSVGMMLPVFSRYEGRGDFAAIRAALLRVTRLGTALSTFVGASVIFYAPAFVTRWMGPGFEASATVAAILCSGLLLALPQSPGVQVLYGVSKHRVYAAINLGEGALNLALSLYLARRYGVYGVAMGAALASALTKLLVQPYFVCRAVGLSVREYLLGAVLGTMLKAGAPLALYFWAVRAWVAPDYGSLLACAALQAALCAPLAYFLALGREERRALSGAARALLRRAQPRPLEALSK